MDIREKYNISRNDNAFDPNTSRANLVESNQRIEQLEKELEKLKRKNMYDSFVLWCEDFMKNGENDKWSKFNPVEEQWCGRNSSYLNKYAESKKTEIEIYKSLDPEGFSIDESGKLVHRDFEINHLYDIVLQVPNYEEKIHIIFDSKHNDDHTLFGPIIIKSKDKEKMCDEIERAKSSKTNKYRLGRKELVEYKTITFSEIKEQFYDKQREDIRE